MSGFFRVISKNESFEAVFYGKNYHSDFGTKITNGTILIINNMFLIP